MIFRAIYERQERQNIKRNIIRKDPEIDKICYDDDWSISQEFSGFECLVTFDPLKIVLKKELLKTLKLNRDSVCAADDVFRHKAGIRIEQTDCNEEFILDISKNYLPKMDDATWDCIINDYAVKNKMYFKYHSTRLQ